MLRMLQTTMLMAFSALSVAAPPQIPDDLKVGAGEQLVLKAHATGFQIYTCKAAADSAPQWELKAPDADLHDRNGRVIGHHFAGPAWKHKDGSEVTGKPNAHVDSPDADSIPWLRLAATGHSGEGVFAQVSTIQRLNTQGGKAPPGAECRAASIGTEARRSYSADYYFYKPAK